MYPITRARGEPPLQFAHKLHMTQWLLSNLDKPVVLVVGPMYYLDARIVGGAMLDVAEELTDVHCWAVTRSGYHEIRYRDADCLMTAGVGSPREDYYPGNKASKAKKAKSKEAPVKEAAKPAPSNSVQIYEHHTSWRDKPPPKAR